MAYPNYYQGGFPQYSNGAVPDMFNQYKGQYIPQMSATNDMIWVLGEVEAMSYPVAPNNNVILWDKNEPVVYIKSVNMQGVPSMRILDYTERIPDNAPKTPNKATNNNGEEFVTVGTFKTLESKFDELWAKVNDITTKPKAKAKEDAE
jgi:hypothetical protein